jgi:hypothetical protein
MPLTRCDLNACAADLTLELVYRGPTPSKSVAPRIDGQSVHSDGHEHVKTKLNDVEEHIEFAKSFAIPSNNDKLQPHVRAAVEYVSNYADCPEQLHNERERKLLKLVEAAAKVAYINEEAISHATPLGMPIAERFNSALLHLMVAATSYPDTTLASDIISGVPNFGDIPASGSHAPSEVPAKLRELEPHYARRLIGSIRRKALKANADQLKGYEDCYEKTMSEVKQGWMLGPFAKSEMDQTFPSGWHPSERFAQFRYPGAPCRPCDNFRTSGINDYNSYHERLVCENAGFPARVGAHFYNTLSRRFDASIPSRCAMAHGTDDLTKAYRQVVVRDHAYNVIAIWNPHKKRVEFFIIRGLPFGSAAAVLQFNRYSQFMAYFLAVYFGVCCASYYDDYDVAEPVYSVHHAQYILRRLHEMVGFMLDKDKHVRAAIHDRSFLGIVTDFSLFCEGQILLRISKERKTKIVAMLTDVKASRSMTAAQASTIRGKLYFCMLAAFNKVGRGPLRAFTERQYSRSTFLTKELVDAIDFFLCLIPNMAPRRIDMVAALRSTLIIWSDAMYEQRGGLGFIAYDPDSDSYYYSAYLVPKWVYGYFRALKTYIGQLEILAVIFAYMTLPQHVLASRPILHYIDNTSSMAGAIKGSSPKRDSAWMLTVMHLIFSMLNVAPWFAYVASKANCSDGPSRFDFAYASQQLRAKWLEPILLTPAQWSSRPQDWIPTRMRRTQRDSGAQRRARKRARSS